MIRTLTSGGGTPAGDLGDRGLVQVFTGYGDVVIGRSPCDAGESADDDTMVTHAALVRT